MVIKRTRGPEGSESRTCLGETETEAQSLGRVKHEALLSSPEFKKKVRRKKGGEPKTSNWHRRKGELEGDKIREA